MPLWLFEIVFEYQCATCSRDYDLFLVVGSLFLSSLEILKLQITKPNRKKLCDVILKSQACNDSTTRTHTNTHFNSGGGGGGGFERVVQCFFKTVAGNRQTFRTEILCSKLSEGQDTSTFQFNSENLILHFYYFYFHAIHIECIQPTKARLPMLASARYEIENVIQMQLPRLCERLMQ